MISGTGDYNSKVNVNARIFGGDRELTREELYELINELDDDIEGYMVMNLKKALIIEGLNFRVNDLACELDNHGVHGYWTPAPNPEAPMVTYEL
jgi:hypothetical protein